MSSPGRPSAAPCHSRCVTRWRIFHMILPLGAKSAIWAGGMGCPGQLLVQVLHAAAPHAYTLLRTLVFMSACSSSGRITYASTWLPPPHLLPTAAAAARHPRGRLAPATSSRCPGKRRLAAPLGGQQAPAQRAQRAGEYSSQPSFISFHPLWVAQSTQAGAARTSPCLLSSTCAPAMPARRAPAYSSQLLRFPAGRGKRRAAANRFCKGLGYSQAGAFKVGGAI